MKKEDLFRAIDLTDDELIAEAAGEYDGGKQRRLRVIRSAAAVAACAALFLTAGYALKKAKEPVALPNESTSLYYEENDSRPEKTTTASVGTTKKAPPVTEKENTGNNVASVEEPTAQRNEEEEPVTSTEPTRREREESSGYPERSTNAPRPTGQDVYEPEEYDASTSQPGITEPGTDAPARLPEDISTGIVYHELSFEGEGLSSSPGGATAGDPWQEDPGVPAEDPDESIGSREKLASLAGYDIIELLNAAGIEEYEIAGTTYEAEGQTEFSVMLTGGFADGGLYEVMIESAARSEELADEYEASRFNEQEAWLFSLENVEGAPEYAAILSRDEIGFLVLTTGGDARTNLESAVLWLLLGEE